jgi:thiol:disulfide interchange protein DsbC
MQIFPNRLARLLILAILGALFAGCEQTVAEATATSEEDASTSDVLAADDEYGHIRVQFPGIEISEIRPSAIPGLLEIMVGADVYYVTDDGRYFIQGEVMDMTTRTNVTDVARNSARVVFLEDFDRASTVEFAADNEEYRVLVFTDIDCGYCRKLHREMAAYNERGITIEYAFFPRSGPNTESWSKAERVWCADSRQEAMTKAKMNEPFESSDCGETPVAEHYSLVNKLGLRGTPSIFTTGGTLQMGYLTPDQLLDVLEAEQL